MNWQLLLPLLITTLVAIGGWVAAHLFTSKRDRENKRRELRVASLISAYRKLSNCVEPVDQHELYARANDLESSIAEINLFGNELQIEEANKFVNDMVSTRRGNIHTLLNLLRQDLRRELMLPELSKPILWIRVSRPENKDL